MKPITSPDAQVTAELLEAVVEPHRGVDTAFAADRPFTALGCGAAHLAAVEMTLLPAVVRLPGAPLSEVNLYRMADRRAALAAYRLDRLLTGAMLGGHATIAQLYDEFRDAFADHVEAESHLLAHAARHLDTDQQRTLAAAMRKAFACAPSRPHAHTPHHRPARGLAFRLEAAIDRVRDALDNRHRESATPRPARPRLGRWGLYLLGSSELPHPAHTADAAGTEQTRSGPTPATPGQERPNRDTPS